MSGFTDKLFIMKLLRWDVHCNTSSLRKHKPSVRSFISLSNIYVTVKACSRNITSSTNLAHKGKVYRQVSVRLSFQGLSSFLGKEKTAKCTYFMSGRCFVHHPLIFAIQTLIISLQHTKLCISLFSQSLWTLCIS